MSSRDAGDAVLRATRGGLLLLAGGLAASLGGLVYWLVMPRLAGLEAVGVASSIVSAAGVATALVSAGLPLAALRESSSGVEGFTASLLASLPLALASSLLALFLAGLLSHSRGLLVWAGLLALSTVLATAALQGVVGLGLFHRYSLAQLAGTLAKLSLGPLLAALGYGAAAVVAGYTSYPLTAMIAALAAASTYGWWRVRPSRRAVWRVLVLTAGNYPVSLSQQLPLMLNVYLYALLGGGAVGTGALYLALMVTVAAAMIPASLTTAALPVGERSGGGRGLIARQLALGMTLAAPMAAALAAAPYQVLHIVKPELARTAWQALAVLAVAVPLLAQVGAAVLELNRLRRPGRIAVVGVARLAVLLALLPPLTRSYGLEGAALAFLASNMAAAIPAAVYMPETVKPTLPAASITLLAALYTLTRGPSPTMLHALARMAAAAALAAAATLATRAVTPAEIKAIARQLIKTGSQHGRLET